MARTSTTEVTIDGRAFKVGKLTLGNLRDLSEMETTTQEGLAQLLLRVRAIHMAILRADPASTLSLKELEDACDGEDLPVAYQAVMSFAGKGSASAGEPQSP